MILCSAAIFASGMTDINSSCVIFALPMVFSRHCFIDHLTLFSAKYCFTPGFLISSVICLDADLKVVPLSETIWVGKPCLAVNLWKLLRSASGLKFGTM